MPDLTAKLAAPPTGDDREVYAVRAALLDSAVRLDAAVPASVVRSYWNDFPVQSAILFAKATGARDGVLTSIDVDPESQRAARTAFVTAGYGPSRLRLINGMGLEVLSRLTDGAYDMVFVDSLPVEYPSHLDVAVRLLRPGGLVVLDDVLRAGHLDDGTAVDSATLAVRELARQVREDERLVPVLLPVSGGLLCALKK